MDLRQINRYKEKMIICFIHVQEQTRTIISIFRMVPTRRIELRAEHYHCSVLPLYYVGIRGSAVFFQNPIEVCHRQTHYIIIVSDDFFN